MIKPENITISAGFKTVDGGLPSVIGLQVLSIPRLDSSQSGNTQGEYTYLETCPQKFNLLNHVVEAFHGSY
jgi:hypothetical protein